MSRCRLHCGRIGRIARSYESTSDEYLRALAPSRAPRDFREGNTNGPGGKRVRSSQTTPRVPSASIHLDTAGSHSNDCLTVTVRSFLKRFPNTGYRISHERVSRLPRGTLKCPTCVYGWGVLKIFGRSRLPIFETIGFCAGAQQAVRSVHRSKPSNDVAWKQREA